jgi:hypothetical protein
MPIFSFDLGGPNIVSGAIEDKPKKNHEVKLSINQIIRVEI